jgi:hypothetical protein
MFNIYIFILIANNYTRLEKVTGGWPCVSHESIARGYRSYEAACIIAGSLPWELAAGLYNDIYNMKAARRIRALQEGQADPLENQGREEVRQGTLLRQRKYEEWKEALSHSRKGLRAVGAILPVLKDWWIGGMEPSGSGWCSTCTV